MKAQNLAKISDTHVIDELELLLAKRGDEVNNWFQENFKNGENFFYNSVDIRRSNFKLAPVDTNIFPAGFNNISYTAFNNSVHEATEFFLKYFPDAKKVLVIAEDNTRNLFYLESLYMIKKIIGSINLDVNFGSLTATEMVSLTSHTGMPITIHPLKVYDGELYADDFVPDVVIMNNDLSNGSPEILKNIKQPVVPKTGFGWFRRRKSEHFESYANVARNFGAKFGIDPFLISTEFEKCGKVNFKEKQGLECVATNVEKLLHRLNEKYKTYGITDEPYVFIKADSGTYGMGIMTVRSGAEVFEINKKIRNKMDVIKGGVVNTEVIIQEGIPTVDRINGRSAEPVIYIVNKEPVGLFYRVNETKDEFGNLNSGGMSFTTVCDENADKKADEPLCKFKVLGLIGKLATLAASKEKYD